MHLLPTPDHHVRLTPYAGIAIVPMTKPLHCPICRKPVEPSSADAPFCSDRCRVLDLGKWASGEYRISSPILDPDLLEELEHAEQQRRPVRETRDDESGTVH